MTKVEVQLEVDWLRSLLDLIDAVACIATPEEIREIAERRFVAPERRIVIVYEPSESRTANDPEL